MALQNETPCRQFEIESDGDLSIPPFLDRRAQKATVGSWRDHLKVHSAAELFPSMSKDELRELGEDIKDNGLRSPIVVYKGELLDGRNRLDAIELAGILDGFRGNSIYLKDRTGVGTRIGIIEHFKGDPYAFVLSANLHRRHLTSEQKRELIAKVLKARPAESNRKIAKRVKADDKTVAAVRRGLESVAEIPHLEKTTGADGKQYKSRRKKPDSSLDTLFKAAGPGRVTEAAEVSIEQRQADMARLAEPAEAVVDEVDRRVNCVANTVRRHVDGLTRSDGARFFAALRDRIVDIEREALPGVSS